MPSQRHPAIVQKTILQNLMSGVSSSRRNMLSNGGIESPMGRSVRPFPSNRWIPSVGSVSPCFDLCMRELLFLAGALGGSKMLIQRNAYQRFLV